MSIRLLRSVLIAIVLAGATAQVHAQADSAILWAENTSASAGESGYVRIMMRSTNPIAGIVLPLSITDTRLIIDSVSTAYSICVPNSQPYMHFSETERRGLINFVPFPFYVFTATTGELLRVHWRVRADAAPGVALVDSFTRITVVPPSDTVIEQINASDWESTSYQCSFIAGEIQMQRYDCGRIGGNGLTDLGNVLYLVNWIFAGGPSPLDNSYGDIDCSGTANVSDAVYLVKYIFEGGPAPCANCP